MDNTIATTPTIFHPVSEGDLLRCWSAVDAADDYAQGANDRRESYVIPALREAYKVLHHAVTYAQQPGAFDPVLVKPLPTPFFDAAEAPSPELARLEVLRLANEMWGTLAVLHTGPQTYENLVRLHRLTSSLLSVLVLSVLMDRY